MLGSINTKKDNTPLSKREITLTDSSLASIRCTLWGKAAEDFEHDGGAVECVVAIKAARLSDYGGRSLNSSFSSQLLINPDIPHASTLRAWYKQGGAAAGTHALTGAGGGGGAREQRIFISQIKDEHLGAGDKPAYFTIKGGISFIRKENAIYRACPTPDCNKKLVEANGELSCEKCKLTTADFKWRLMLTFAVADSTGQQWVTAFQEQAEAILGKTADELGALQTDNQAAFDAYLTDCQHKVMVFKCRGKIDNFNVRLPRTDRARDPALRAGGAAPQGHVHHRVADRLQEGVRLSGPRPLCAAAPAHTCACRLPRSRSSCSRPSVFALLSTPRGPPGPCTCRTRAPAARLPPPPPRS